MKFKVVSEDVPFPKSLTAMVGDVWATASDILKFGAIQGDVELTFDFIPGPNGKPIAAALARSKLNPANFRINILPLALTDPEDLIRILFLEFVHLDQILNKKLIRDDNGDVTWEGKRYTKGEIKSDGTDPWFKVAEDTSEYLLLEYAKRLAVKAGLSPKRVVN